MIRISSEKDAVNFLQTALRASEAERADLARYQARCRCYDIGVQWVQQARAPEGWGKITREAVNLVGEAGPIRATINRITKLRVQIAAATNPDSLYVDAMPGDRASSILDSMRADAIESAVNAMIDAAGLVRTARTANTERVVSGLHGIGLACEQERAGPEGPPSKTVRAFDFDACRLSLDPANTSFDLRDHEYVIYSEVMTVHAARRRWGESFITTEDEKKLRTVGDIMPVEMQFHSLSGGALYRRYHAHSATRALLVHYLHPRGADGRYGRLIAVAEAVRGSFRVVYDGPSPFGGDGLPYVLLRGWHRPQSRAPISDVGMMIDDQDKLNLIASLYFQQVWNHTGQYGWIIDNRWFTRQTTAADIHRAIFGRVIIGDPHPDARPPSLVTYPTPSVAMEQTMARYEAAMESQGFRAEAHQGKTKSHVTTTAFIHTLELSELPLDDRADEDAGQYEKLINVLAGTMILALRERSLSTARTLVRAGLDESELGLVAESDPFDIPADLKIAQPSLRHRSRSSRRQDLIKFAGVAGLTGPSVRRILARDLDQPISDMDRHVLTYARAAAASVMLGGEFRPVPLGPELSEIVIEELRRAATSPQAARIDGAADRLSRAIILQQQIDAPAGPAPAAEPATPGASGDALVMQGIFG